MSVPFHMFIQGERFEASYTVNGPHVVVSSPYGMKRAQLGLTPAPKMAKALLRVILRDVARLSGPAPIRVAPQRKPIAARYM